MRNDSKQGRADNPISGIRELFDPQEAPMSCYWQAVVQTVKPLSVAIGELVFYENEIVLCRQLTERVEEVEPISWQTENETCHVTHRHTIQGKKQLKVFCPIQIGDVLLCLPSADQQTLIAIDILSK